MSNKEGNRAHSFTSPQPRPPNPTSIVVKETEKQIRVNDISGKSKYKKHNVGGLGTNGAFSF
jgi:hypothetical protein